MTIAKPSLSMPPAAIPAVWRRKARIEKIRYSNNLNGERPDTHEQAGFAAARLARAQVCRNETCDAAPDWEEQRLVPAFVTQLLAQAIPPPEKTSPASPYRNRAPRIAFFCDRMV